jgi:hypothetical protein
VLLIALAIFDWFAVLELRRDAAVVGEQALYERADASLILTIAASVVAVLSGFYLAEARFPFGGVLLIGSLVALSVPQILWVVSKRRGRFR